MFILFFSLLKSPNFINWNEVQNMKVRSNMNQLGEQEDFICDTACTTKALIRRKLRLKPSKGGWKNVHSFKECL